MQITDINKLVRLFLLGSYGAFLLTLQLSPDLLPSIAKASIDRPGFAIPLGLLFLGVITALGSAIEGLAQFTVGKFLQESLKRPWIGVALCKSEEVARVRDWNLDFEEASKRAADVPYESRAAQLQQKSLAGGLVHKSAPPEHVKYLDIHYNIFVLSSGFAILFFISPLPTFLALTERGASPLFMWLVTAAFLISGYSLCSLALTNYLFVWEASFRFGCLLLWEKPKKSSIRPLLTSTLPQNPGVAADD